MITKTRHCVFCGKETARLRYCSTRCRQLSARRKSGAHINCVVCGKQLEVFQRSYCGKTCLMQSKGKKLVNGKWVSIEQASCKVCGKAYHKLSRNQVFCGPDCREASMENRLAPLEKQPVSSDWIVYEQGQDIARFRHVHSKRQHTKCDWIHQYELEYLFSDGKVRRERLEQAGKLLTPGQLDQLFLLVFANHHGISHHEAAARAAG